MRAMALVMGSMAVLGACAPAPLYTASGSGRGSAHGEIPRDGLGEPIWHLIRPARASQPRLTQEQAEQMASQGAQVIDEGSRLDGVQPPNDH